MLSLTLMMLCSSEHTLRAEELDFPPPLAGVRRVVFLGDSITYAGRYVAYLEAFLRLRDPGLRCEVINLGLPSETVSGLTEPGHAGGAFPRPDLHERLDRVLEKCRPDLIVACYGMNDGIYHPFSESRFEKFKQGLFFLREEASGSRTRVLHLTPPVFDPLPIKTKTLPAGLLEYRQPYEGYDDVLARYSAWLLERREDGWDVVDIHGPMSRHLEEARGRDPGFRLAEDGIHLDKLGHWLIAQEILLHWGVRESELGPANAPERVFASRQHGPEILELVTRKQALLKDAWLTAIGHSRPGMARGLPLDRAVRKADEVEVTIRRLVAEGRSAP
jgi:lysophospholipase L1-like esterase